MSTTFKDNIYGYIYIYIDMYTPIYIYEDKIKFLTKISIYNNLKY